MAPEAADAIARIDLIEGNTAPLHGVGHCEAYWPCADDQQAIGSLRSATHTCPDEMDQTRGTELDPDVAGVHCDVTPRVNCRLRARQHSVPLRIGQKRRTRSAKLPLFGSNHCWC
jgi:hypothetical protein